MRVGYTFDAGPNAVLLTTEEHMPGVLAAVMRFFPPPLAAAAGFVNKPALRAAAKTAVLPTGLEERFKLTVPGAIKYVYATGIGPGAARLSDSKTLADAKGAPLEVAKPKGAALVEPRLALALVVAAVGVAAALRAARK